MKKNKASNLEKGVEPYLHLFTFVIFINKRNFFEIFS